MNSCASWWRQRSATIEEVCRCQSDQCTHNHTHTHARTKEKQRGRCVRVSVCVAKSSDQSQSNATVFLFVWSQTHIPIEEKDQEPHTRRRSIQQAMGTHTHKKTVDNFIVAVRMMKIIILIKSKLATGGQVPGKEEEEEGEEDETRRKDWLAVEAITHTPSHSHYLLLFTNNITKVSKKHEITWNWWRQTPHTHTQTTLVTTHHK